MGIIINEKYKDTVKAYEGKDISPFNRAVYMLEDLAENKEVNYDYSTIAKAVIESYLGEEINIEKE